MNHHPIDLLSDAVLLHERAREIHRQRSLIAIERERAIADAWLAGVPHREIARALDERPGWVREQLYLSGHDPVTQWPY